jgi:hypothetical protein
MKWTGIRAVTLAAVVALGAGTIGAAPAQAADLGSTVVTADIPFLVFSPNPLNGAVGDSFTVTNNSGQTIEPISGGSTGVISHESSGTLPDCFLQAALCDVGHGSSKVFYIRSLGTITFTDGVNTGPLHLEAGGGEVTDPALVYPTASINANGGTCQGPTQYIKYQGQNAASGTFTAPTADTCTRTNYSLAGWARSATATTSEFAPGSTVTIGDEGFTLFAVWRPNGIEIVYDANVGLGTQCLSSNGTNLTTAAERQTTPTVVPASSAAAAQAPCTPPGHTLNGWSLTGAGPTTLVKGAALPASFTGTSQTLYAKWEPDRFDLSVQADSLIVNSAEPLRPLRICAGVSQLVTFTATKNGVAAAGQIIDVEIARTGASSTTQKLTTDASGRVQVNFKLDRNYTPQVVSGSFANQVARLIFVERDSPQCVETITITGERTTVSGKPGIMVEGVTTGFAAGAVVKPYFRFPGETSYTESSARPVVDASGRFTWTRKTGKKLYAYMVSEDGSVQSNRVIIPAN